MRQTTGKNFRTHAVRFAAAFQSAASPSARRRIHFAELIAVDVRYAFCMKSLRLEGAEQ